LPQGRDGPETALQVR